MAIIIGKNLNFLVAAPSSTPAPFFTVILTGTKQLFDCGLSNIKLQKTTTTTKKYNFIYFLQVLGSNIFFLKFAKSTLTIDLFSEFSCKS